MRRLNHQFVSNCVKPGRYFDAGTNLHLLVRAGATGPNKYWIYRSICSGRRTDKSLGVYPGVSLGEARKRALELKYNFSNSLKDCENNEEIKITSPTFQSFAEDWVELNKSQWSNQKHYRQWLSTLATYAYPVLANVPLCDVSTNHLLEILQPIWSTKVETASRLRERLERILAAAVAKRFIDHNPAVWKGHLQQLLPPPAKIKSVRHHAAVPYEELPFLFDFLGQKRSLSACALRFLILNASRTGEVIGARWSEIESNIWTIPAERMKARKMHRVPLAKLSVQLLAEVDDPSGCSDYIFAAKGRPLSNMAMRKTLISAFRGEATVHGFRSSFRIWAAERSGMLPEVAEMALAHNIGTPIERVYLRSDLLDLRRELMERWADFLLGVQR